jgi:hypothetical protein
MFPIYGNMVYNCVLSILLSYQYTCGYPVESAVNGFVVELSAVDNWQVIPKVVHKLSTELKVFWS